MAFGNDLSLYIVVVSSYFLTATIAHEAIVGGILALRTNELSLYTVSLQYRQNHHACGGGLIRNQFVVTAAHCVVDHNNDFIPGRMYVCTTTNTVDEVSQWNASVQVQQIYVPKEYNPKNFVADIAVLKLSEALRHPGRDENNNHLIALSKDEPENLVDQSASIAGFGWNRVRPRGLYKVIGTSDNRLYYARANVIPNAECEYLYPSGIVKFTMHFCARAQRMHGLHRPTGVCTGDTGGVLVREDASTNKTAIGVLVKRSPLCDERIHPAIYTRVSQYREFIERALAGHVTEDMRWHEVQHAHT